MDNKNEHFRHIMLFYFNKGKNAAQTSKKICVVYGKDVVKERVCQKWFAKFRSGKKKTAKIIGAGLGYSTASSIFSRPCSFGLSPVSLPTKFLEWTALYFRRRHQTALKTVFRRKR